MREADMTRLPRAAIAADRIGAADTAVAALFAALWREPAPLATREDIFAILKGAGIDPASLGDIDPPGLARAFEEATDAAAKRRLFGSPTFFVGTELFFGNDSPAFVFHDLPSIHLKPLPSPPAPP